MSHKKFFLPWIVVALAFSSAAIAAVKNVSFCNDSQAIGSYNPIQFKIESNPAGGGGPFTTAPISSDLGKNCINTSIGGNDVYSFILYISNGTGYQQCGSGSFRTLPTKIVGFYYDKNNFHCDLYY